MIWSRMKELESIWFEHGVNIPSHYKERLNERDIEFINELQDYYG